MDDTRCCLLWTSPEEQRYCTSAIASLGLIDKAKGTKRPVESREAAQLGEELHPLSRPLQPEVFECTQRAMPPSTSDIPIHVSVHRQSKALSPSEQIKLHHTSLDNLPFCPPLSQHSEKKRQRISDGHCQAQFCLCQQRRRNIACLSDHIPACPMSRKNHTLPVTLSSKGTAYAGFLRRSSTA